MMMFHMLHHRFSPLITDDEQDERAIDAAEAVGKNENEDSGILCQ